MAGKKNKPSPEKNSKKAKAKGLKENHKHQNEAGDFGGIPAKDLKKNLGCGG